MNSHAPRTHTPQRRQTPLGDFVLVQFMDGSPAQEVFVRLLEPRCYPDLVAANADEARQAEIFTCQDSAFIDSLHPESVEDIVVSGLGLNEDLVARRNDRIAQRM